MKKLLVVFIVTVFIGVLASLNTTKFNHENVSLSNIAALSSAQAEYGSEGCSLISLELCKIALPPFPAIYGWYHN